MPRAVWTGNVKIGKVVVAAQLHKAAEHDDFPFKSVHRACNTPISQSRSCVTCNVDLPTMDDTARAVEVGEGTYVIVENDELQAALGTTLDLRTWVFDEQVPGVVGTTWWISPKPNDRYATRALSLLTAAMINTDLAGLGTIALYSKERLVAVRLVDGQLAAQALYVGSELRTPPAWPTGDHVVIAGDELRLMTELLESRRKDTTPKLLTRLLRRRVPDLVAQKVAGGDVVQAPVPAATVDLLGALTRSLPKKTSRA